MIRIIAILLLLHNFSTIAQDYPQNYFRDPIDTPFVIAGTFGEVRPDHFHSGIDFSTQNDEGKPVYAAAEGFISRIKISADGFGKALYITHPNGFVTVYAHLKKYSGAIEKYAYQKQYSQENFEIELFPEEKELSVKKGEVIAISGNSGRSSAPHLHFEIRDKESEEPINPMLFGYVVPDITKPDIKSVRIIPVGTKSMVGNNDSAKTFSVIKGKDALLLKGAKSISVSGKIGFEFTITDRQNGSNSDLGIYSLEFKIDNYRVFGFKYNRLNFSDMRYVNAHIDYAADYDGIGVYERCFKLPGDKLKIYIDTAKSGYFYFNDDKVHRAEVIVSDFNNNISVLHFTLQGSTSFQPSDSTSAKRNERKLLRQKSLFVQKKNFHVTIPANAVYENTFFSVQQLSQKKGYYSRTYQIGDPHVPLHIPITIGIRPSTLPERLRSKAVVVSFNKKGKETYEGSGWQNDFIVIKTKHFGTFAIAVDTTSPSVSPFSFPSDSKTGSSSFQFKISDQLSGIKSYRVEIDGQWNLAEFDKKNNLLSCDLSPLSQAKTHEFTLTVTDNVGNSTIISNKFYY